MKNGQDKNDKHKSLNHSKLTQKILNSQKAFKPQNWWKHFHIFRCYYVNQLYKNKKLTCALNVVNTLLNEQRYGPIRCDQVLKRHPKIVAFPISTSWWIQWLCGLCWFCLLRKKSQHMITINARVFPGSKWGGGGTILIMCTQCTYPLTGWNKQKHPLNIL